MFVCVLKIEVLLVKGKRVLFANTKEYVCILYILLIEKRYSGHDKYRHFPLFIALNNNALKQIRTSRYTADISS